MRARRPRPSQSRIVLGAVLSALLVAGVTRSGLGQDYDPLAEREAEKRGRQDGGHAGDDGGRRDPPGADRVIREDLAPSPPTEERMRGVEREDLSPVMSADGSGLPQDVWSGLSLEEFAGFVGALSLPPQSPTLAGLWRRLITAPGNHAAGSDAATRFTALRVEAMDQSGLVDEAAAVLARDLAAERDPLLRALTARSEVGLGNTDRGCEIGRELRQAQGELPAPIRADVLLINGLCAAARGDMEGAALQAGLLRELGLSGLAGIDFLDAVASNAKPVLPPGARLTPLDYRVAALKGHLDRDTLVAAATPALLVGLARDPRAAPDVRLAAGEAAGRLHLLEAKDLALLYRVPGAGGDAGTIERAGLFKSAEAERTPLRKARLIRGFLDEARRAGFSWTALRVVAPFVRDIEPQPEIGWFVETAIETQLAGGDFIGVRRWAEHADPTGVPRPGTVSVLAHWIALADLVDPGSVSIRARHLDAVERLAANGRFGPELLHRLVTVLDALDINVPIPLWDVASRTPQPAGGHLPDTGVLSQLADASRKKDFARTVLLVMRTIGPSGADGAHMIALGDSLRALRRAGLDADARQLALEALLADWPHMVSP